MKNENELVFSCLVYKNTFDDTMDFEEIKNILQEVGVKLSLYEKGEYGYFGITLDKDIYESKKTRGAGRHYRKATKPDEEYDDLKITVTKSDVIYMMQSMKDKEIAKSIDMPIATYYRHKKRLTDSIAFQSLDPNRLQDKEYLEDNIYGAF